MFNFSIFFVFLGSFSGDRTFYSLTALCIFLKFLLFGRKIVTKSNVIILLTAISTFLYLSIFFILPLFSDQRNIKLVGGRTLLWSTILSDWNKTGLFGHGPNTMAEYMYLHTGQIAYGNAHNSFLQYLWDYGLLGIFFYSAFILCLMIVISTKVNNVRHISFMLIFLSYQGDDHLSLTFSIIGLYLILLLTAVFERDEKDVSNPGQAIMQKGWR
jgi:O-antigen ligase